MKFAFELDTTPALVGVGIYVGCQLVLWLVSPRRPFPQQAKVKDCDVEEVVQPQSANVPECPVKSRNSCEQKGARHLSFWLLLAAAIVLRILLPYWQKSRGGIFVESETLPTESPTVPSSTHQVHPVVDTLKSTEAPVPKPAKSERAEVDLAADGTEAALKVKLTRQAMNDDNYIRSAYYGTVSVGTPALEMTVIFDTGSGHLILPSMYCKSDTCKAHTRYRRSASSTARDIDTHGNSWQQGPRDSVTVSFGTGEVTGVFVEDIVCMSNAVGNDTLSRQFDELDKESLLASRPDCTVLHFVAATELSEDPFKSFHFDGILGLGLSGLSQTSKFNFMDVMSQSLHLGGRRMPHTFGVFLADNEHEESEVALGGWASAHLREDLSWGPIHDPELGHWVVPIRGIRVDNEPLDFCDDGNCRAAVDTGTSLLSVPSSVFREMYEGLRHSAPPVGHCHGFGPLLHIELHHFTVTLGPREYAQVKNAAAKSKPPRKRLVENGNMKQEAAQRQRSDLRCLPMLMTLDLEEPLGPKLFILGEPVLRKYYTVYDGDKKQVGFGRAKHRTAPTREELFEMAPQFGARPRQRLPNMFDIFRWRKEASRQ